MRYTVRLAPAVLAASLVALAGCQGVHVAAVAPVAIAMKPAPVVDGPPSAVKADEAGRIPILMYHSVGAPPIVRGPRFDRRGLNIRTETFRKQLETMYKAGFYPLNMRDVLTPRIDVPAGKTPVVITFDDARESQFKYLKDGRIDPTCAVGVLMAFHASHPDWPLKATFYVLPASKYNPVPFWQPGKETAKLRFLAQQGFEVANHTTSHRSLGPMNAQTLRWEMAECQKYVQQRVPGLVMDTMALPYGVAPRNHALWKELLNGSEGGVQYHSRCILLAAGEPEYPPTTKKWNPLRLMRVGSEPGYIEMWIKHLRAGQPYRRYVSDGNPDVVTVPKAQEALVDRARLAGLRLVTYDDGTQVKKATAVAKKRKSTPVAEKRA